MIKAKKSLTGRVVSSSFVSLGPRCSAASGATRPAIGNSTGARSREPTSLVTEPDATRRATSGSLAASTMSSTSPATASAPPRSRVRLSATPPSPRRPSSGDPMRSRGREWSPSSSFALATNPETNSRNSYASMSVRPSDPSPSPTRSALPKCCPRHVPERSCADCSSRLPAVSRSPGIPARWRIYRS